MIHEQKGVAEAESLLEDLGFDTLPITPVSVANEINDESFPVVIENQRFDSESILGAAVGNEAGALIYINSNIPDPGRYNFTAAHELGHVCMHIMGGISSSFECGAREFSNQYEDPKEQEANGFASGLLMPKKLIIPQTDGEITWANIEHIKRLCGTSLEATFRRMISLNCDPAALVIHKNGKFLRYVKSDSFSPYIAQTPLSQSQKALCSDGLTEGLTSDFDLVDAIDWVKPSRRDGKLESIFSSSISLTNGIVYTLLKYDDDCFSELEDA